MSFIGVLDTLLLRKPALVQQFQRLIAPISDSELEEMARRASQTTRRFFGRTMRLFAPLYLSNECINNCRYCGFSRDNPILRITLTPEQVRAEAHHLYQQGFRNVLLVAGEHPKFVTDRYLADCISLLRPEFSSVAVELGPMETEHYKALVDAGADGLVVYQETYDRPIYAAMHTSGPKRDFNFRLECAERAYAAGFSRLGIGALFGLAPWLSEAIALAAHVDYLTKHCWKSDITVSLPRLRPAAGEFEPPFSMSDRELTQLVCAFRLTFPQVGIVLSTRESMALRDALAPLGVTIMSAGSHTEPGGYTRQGADDVHLTVRGRILPPDSGIAEIATSQFQISDSRSPHAVAAMLRQRGLEPVGKDWDHTLTAR